MDFKIVFPVGYQVNYIYEDNLDINIILHNEDVFFGTLFTINNIKSISDKSKESFFSSTAMLIVKDLSKKTIYKSISELLANGYLGEVFTKIGTVSSVFPNSKSFNEVEDMC